MRRTPITTGLLVVTAVSLLVGCSNPYLFNVRIKYEVYPQTDAAPLLVFVWDDRDGLAGKTAWIGPVGIWEGSGNAEPATEIEMHMSYAEPQPVYAYAPGTVTDVSDGDTVTVRYGTSYGVTYYHLTNIAESASEGSTVEVGDLLGYTETMDGGEFWEISVGKVTGGGEGAVIVLPIDYFDAESKGFLTTMAQASGDTWIAEPDPTPGTSVETKGDSWIDEVATVHYPDDLRRYGYRFAPSYEGSIEDWIESRETATGRDLRWLYDSIASAWNSN